MAKRAPSHGANPPTVTAPDGRNVPIPAGLSKAAAEAIARKVAKSLPRKLT